VKKKLKSAISFIPISFINSAEVVAVNSHLRKEMQRIGGCLTGTGNRK
jgi:hypothetical protein